MFDVTQHPMRDEISAICLKWAIDCGGTYPIEGARKYLSECKDGVHRGDCTKEPMTCLRCTCDDAYKQSDEILTALVNATTSS